MTQLQLPGIKSSGHTGKIYICLVQNEILKKFSKLPEMIRILPHIDRKQKKRL